MNPAEHVRVVLVEARRRGLPFGEAWMLAIQTLPRPTDPPSLLVRREWLAELAWSRPFFHCAFVGRPFGDVDPLADVALVDVVQAA